MKNLTDFRKTVETGVNPRLPLYLFLLLALPILFSFFKYKIHAMWVAIKWTTTQWQIQGRGLASLNFRPNWARNKFFGDQAPGYIRVWMTAPPSPPPFSTPYLKVWIGNDNLPICTVIRSFHITTFSCFSCLLLLFSLFQYDLTYTMKYKQLLAVLMW